MHTIYFMLGLYTSTVTCAQLPAMGSQLVHYNRGLNSCFTSLQVALQVPTHVKANAYL